MDDLTQLILYIAIGIVGLVASAYRNRKKQQTQRPQFPTDSAGDTMPEVQPDLGPLAELFGIPEIQKSGPVFTPVEDEPSVEDKGYLVEEEGFQLEKSGLEIETQGFSMEKEGMEAEKIEKEGTSVFAITESTMISDSISDTATSDYNGVYEAILDTEIKDESLTGESVENKGISWKDAVIYSEILKRREI
jgi:hypothetical protein